MNNGWLDLPFDNYLLFFFSYSDQIYFRIYGNEIIIWRFLLQLQRLILIHYLMNFGFPKIPYKNYSISKNTKYSYLLTQSISSKIVAQSLLWRPCTSFSLFSQRERIHSIRQDIWKGLTQILIILFFWCFFVKFHSRSLFYYLLNDNNYNW